MVKVRKPSIALLAEAPIFPGWKLLEQAPGKQQRKLLVLGCPLWYMLELYRHSADMLGQSGELHNWAIIVSLVRPSAMQEGISEASGVQTLSFPETKPY